MVTGSAAVALANPVVRPAASNAIARAADPHFVEFFNAFLLFVSWTASLAVCREIVLLN